MQITMPDGTKRRLAGTPAINTKKAAEDAERAHIEREINRHDIAQIVERLLNISGEDGQTIDRKHREAYTGKLAARITIVSNELPRFTDASDALPGRLLVLQLTESFYGKEDTDLTAIAGGSATDGFRWRSQCSK